MINLFICIGYSVGMLDNVQLIRELDKGGMFEVITSLPDHFREGAKIAKKIDLKRFNPKHIVVTGMGGSSIAGDILASWLRDEIEIPIIVHRDYSLPRFVGEKDFVVAISYSGDTRETLSAMKAALKGRSKVVCVTSGGKLEQMCQQEDVPFVKIPSGLPPRGAIGFLFSSLPILLQKMGIRDSEKDIESVIQQLTFMREKLVPETTTENNPAKKIAIKIFGKTPVVYSSRAYTAIGKRWQNQFNENSKVLAWSGPLPEIDHNEIVGWNGDEGARRYVPIILRDERESGEMERRLDATKRVLEKRTKVLEIQGKGETLLARMFHCLYIGDFASAYLAALRGVDPTQVKAIEELKKMLEGG